MYLYSGLERAKMKEISITTPYIKLGQMLKVASLIQTGGEEKTFVASHKILVNGESENRRGRKLYPNDKVDIDSQLFLIK